MVISVPGEYYVYETEQLPDKESLKEFFKELNENDVLELRIRSSEESEYKVYHISKIILQLNLDFFALSLEKAENTFEQMARIAPYEVPIPVLDTEGNCVSILKKIVSYYEHFYRYEGELDLFFLNRYDSIVLEGINEYSVEIYKKVLPRWKGKEVFLVSPEWNDYVELFPTIPGITVTILDCLEQMEEVHVPSDETTFPAANVQTSCTDIKGNTNNDRKRLLIKEGTPSNESIERYKRGIMYYDEIMTLTFLFSYVIHPGKRNPDKKFLLIDAFFRIEGMFAIWEKVFTVARYALAKGYTPVFQIVSSDENIYSDHESDDIWNKFFRQPGGYTIDEVHQSSYLALSPNMNVLNVMRCIMDEVSNGIRLIWPNGIFNQQVKAYIQERQERFLPCPERTLGVLIRGTDYTKTALAGHNRHASPEMIIEKIGEIENFWEFDSIFLSTEDEEICTKIKAYYGDRVSYTDQERYTIEPGQLLVDLHVEKKEGEGFRLGAEYLCTVHLLSQCCSLIASGNCGAVKEALRQNDGKYQHVYVFHP